MPSSIVEFSLKENDFGFIVGLLIAKFIDLESANKSFLLLQGIRDRVVVKGEIEGVSKRNLNIFRVFD